MGCRLGIDYGLLKLARETNIPVVISGGSPVDASTNYKYNLVKLDPRKKGKFNFVMGYLHKISQNLSLMLDINSIRTQIKEYCFHYTKRYRKNKYMTKISPFYRYIKWNEKKIMLTIENELHWKKDPRISSISRGDCDIALLKSYTYKRLLGYNDKDCELSYLIRDGQITREEAMQRLENEGDINEEVVWTICNHLKIDYLSLLKHLRKSRVYKCV